MASKIFRLSWRASNANINRVLRTPTKIGALLLVVIAVAACAIQRAQEAADARAKMVGMSKEQILSCMGAPTNTAYAGSTEVWTYDSGNGRTDSYGDVSVWGNGYHANGFGWSTTTARFCKVDVVMDGGRVTRLNYRGPTGGLLTKGEQCAFAIDNCTAQASTLATSPEPVAQTAPQYGVPPVSSPNVSVGSTPIRACTAQDRELARAAKEQGFQYHSDCQ